MKIFVMFVIEKDGTLSDIKFLQDAGFGIGKEIGHVIKLDKTSWISGKVQPDLTVRAMYTMPVIINPNVVSKD